MIPEIKIIFKDPNWRPKVLVTHYDVPLVGIDVLREKCDVTVCKFPYTKEEVLQKIQGMDGVLWGSLGALNSEILDAAGPQLKSISTISAGFDFVDIEELKRRKIPLGCTRTTHKNAVAGAAVGLAIAASRRFYEGRLKIENSQWEHRAQWMGGQEICNSTVGIVGFGGIGQTIAKRLSGFDVGQFLYCGHNKKLEADKFNAKFVPFLELVERSDFIFIICPLTEETRKMFNAEVFGRMKPTSVLINIARGDIVDQEALYGALKNHKIFAAGLDVVTPEPLPPDHPLLSLPNCVIIPHIAFATVKAREDAARAAAYNVLAGLADQPMCLPAY